MGRDDSAGRSRWWVIGIDSADWEYINPMIERGRMPVFRELISNGVRAPLRTVIPPFSAPAWTTFATGCLPGKHGIFDFIQITPGTYDFHTTVGGERKSEPLWRILDRNGVESVVVNLPMTYPPDPVKGFMVSGLDAPGEGAGITHPPELWDEIRGWGPYKIYPAPKGRTFKEYAVDLWETMETQADVFLRLMDRSGARLGILVLAVVDMIGHLCLNSDLPGAEVQTGLFQETYLRMDALLGRILEQKPSDTAVMLVSDHGARPAKEFFLLDQWLVNEGLMNIVGAEAGGGDRASSGSGFWFMARKGLVWADRIIPRSIRLRLRKLRQLKKRMETALWQKSINWDRTRAFTCNIQGIYINLQGRYPKGNVSEAEYPALVENIKQRLLKLTSPSTGELMVDQVLTREQAYPGPLDEIGPDLYIMWRDGYMGLVRKLGGLHQPPLVWDSNKPLPSEGIRVWNGIHSPVGILAASGPGIRSGVELPEAGIQDIAPTLLVSLGLNVPENMDGKVISDMFINPPGINFESRIDKDGSSRERGFSEEEERARRQMLENLGYF